MKKIFNFNFSLFTLVLLLFASCSESDDTVEEFPNWQKTNEAYVKSLYADAKAKIAAGDNSWKIIRNYSMPDSDEDYKDFPNPYTEKPEDCIIVHVQESGSGTDCPLSTDKVRVHYAGRLIPSTSYPEGLVFDKSYYGTLDVQSATPSEFTVNGVVDGFSTALQHMHVGDRWTVYIPYQLGYGKKAQSSIPAYSTLIFDITLQSFFRPDAENVPGNH